MSELLPIGTLVRHGFGISGHGPGRIVAYNSTEPNKYLEEKFTDAVEMAAKVPAGISGLVGSFYDKERFPYVIQFENGYRDVYDADNFEVIKKPAKEFSLTTQSHKIAQDDYDNEIIHQIEARWSIAPALYREDEEPCWIIYFISGGFTLRYRIYDKAKDVGIEMPWKYVQIKTPHDLQIEQRIGLSSAPRHAFALPFEFDEMKRLGAKEGLRLLKELGEGEEPAIDFEVFFTYESMPEKEYLTRTLVGKVDVTKYYPDPPKINRMLKERNRLDNLERWTCKDCGTNHFKE